MGIREIPARRPDADHADEVGGRGDGDRPDLQGSVHEGVPLARARFEWTPVFRPQHVGSRVERRGRSAAARAGRSQRPPHVVGVPRARARMVGGANPQPDENRSLVPHPVLADCRAVPLGGAGRPARHLERHAADAEAGRDRRPGAGGDPRRRRSGGARGAGRERPRAGLQADRHLRGGIRVVHAVSLRHVREGVRGRSDAAAESGDPRQRSEPDRPGARVRLLLLPCGVCAARRGVRDRNDQLQPRDGVDRLRHGRPPVLRAADL